MHADAPLVTADRLAAALAEHNLADPDRLAQILGADRFTPTVPAIERAVVSHNVCSVRRLLALKGALTGLRTFEVGKISPHLPQPVAYATGALLVQAPRPVVAMIEDLPDHLEALAQHLGTRDFEVVLITAPQFAELVEQTYYGVEADERAVLGDVWELFDEALRRKATDIHLQVGAEPVLRVDGSLIKMSRQPLDRDWLHREMTRLAGPERMAAWEARKDIDFAFAYGIHRFRMNLGEDNSGITLAARALSTKVPTPDDIGLPTSVRQFIHLERGLVLVTGPTGSGKSTTLAALLDYMARTQDRHLITLEDPIEYYLTAGKAVVNQRERGQHFPDFSTALRQALRQDPDVILVGEMRDQETIRTALTAAETGHLVFGTLHTYDVASTVQRIVSEFPANEQDQVRAQLAYTLKGVVSQTLLPKANRAGRVAALEIMIATPAISNNLRRPEGVASLKTSIETGKQHGMQTMEMALADLVRRQLVREADAEFKARDVEDFQRRLRSEDH